MFLIQERQKSSKDVVMTKKKIFSTAIILIAAFNAFAQGDGSAEINEATTMITGYFDPATKLIYAIGAIVGLIGGVKVYGKFSSGDPTRARLPHRGLVRVCSLSWQLLFYVSFL